MEVENFYFYIYYTNKWPNLWWMYAPVFLNNCLFNKSITVVCHFKENEVKLRELCLVFTSIWVLYIQNLIVLRNSDIALL